MFNQRKAYIENDNAIQALVNREHALQRLDVDLPLKVKLAADGKTVQLIHNGVVLNGEVKRPLIHQLGGRAWGQNQDFRFINQTWLEKFAQNRAELEQELASVFRKHDLSIRYDANPQGQNRIYGIVTPHFIDVNQLEFRKTFMEQIRQTTGLVPESTGIEISKHQQVIEFFKFDSPGFQTEFQYGLVYAKNNGYEAYRVDWERFILICTNGLKRRENVATSIWKHTKQVNLAQFITHAVADGVGNQVFLEQRIASSQNAQLNQNRIMELMERMSLAQASKARVNQRLAIESKQVGHNEWALSQSLTWLGSHEKSIPPRSRQQLIGLGTDVLEYSLDEVLEGKSEINSDDSYGLLLPKGFKRS